LKSLLRALLLARNEIQHYENTPLYQNLVNIVNPEVEKCYPVLRKLLDRINQHRQSLVSTVISNFWRPVLLYGWEPGELASLEGELSACRRPLDLLLKGLASYVSLIARGSRNVERCHIHSGSWTELGNQMQAGLVSIEDVRSALRQRSRSLDHVHDSIVLVVDHLGMVIPIPILFCSTWKVGFVSIMCRLISHHLWCRDFMTSSKYIAKTASEIVTSNEATIMSYVLMIVRSLNLWSLSVR